MSLSLRFLRWTIYSLFFVAFLALAPRAHASAANETALDANALAQLEQRALSAKPADQCYLFTELFRHLTEVAGKQMADGQFEQAQATLHHMDEITAKIHATMDGRARHLVDSELLLSHASHRLTDMLHVSSSVERDTLQATLKHLEEVHSEMLTQVFAH